MAMVFIEVIRELLCPILFFSLVTNFDTCSLFKAFVPKYFSSSLNLYRMSITFKYILGRVSANNENYLGDSV